MATDNEKAELHKAIWGISEDLCEFIDEGEHEAGDSDFSYAAMSDEDAEAARSGITEDKGYFMLPSQLFCNVAKDPARDSELNIKIDGVFKAIEASSIGQPSEKDFKGLFDDVDVTSNKLGGNLDERRDRLAKIIIGIRDLDFGKVDESHIDLFGDAYEYLMNMYASGAGKSGGEFFTPQEVSELLARIVIGDKTSVNKVYDPACGSGSLLLKFAKILGVDVSARASTVRRSIRRHSTSAASTCSCTMSASISSTSPAATRSSTRCTGTTNLSTP